MKFFIGLTILALSAVLTANTGSIIWAGIGLFILFIYVPLAITLPKEKLKVLKELVGNDEIYRLLKYKDRKFFIEYTAKNHSDNLSSLFFKWCTKKHSATVSDTYLKPSLLDTRQALIDVGVDINAVISYTKEEYFDTAKLLIDAGADVNAVNGCDTALMWASTNGRIDITELLIDLGADVNVVNGCDTALTLAAKN